MDENKGEIKMSAIEYTSSYTGTEIDGSITKVNSHTASWIYNDNLLPTGNNNEYCGMVVKKTAGENVIYGNICYMSSSGELMKAQASSSEKMPGLYLAVEDITSGDTGSFLRRGWATSGSWDSFTSGEYLYIESGSNDGIITNVTASGGGAVVQVVGIANEENRIDFDPSMVIIELSDE
jgi:hypothetical protein